MEKYEILKLKCTNQIHSLFETLLEMQKITDKEWYKGKLDYNSEITLSMCFFNLVLINNVFEKFDKLNLSKEERLKLIVEIWNATHEHYKELYWFNSKK